MEPRKTGTATDPVETGDQEMKSTDDNFKNAVPEEMGSSSDQVGLSLDEGRLQKDDVTWMSTALENFRLELIEKERQLEADQAEKERQLKADLAERDGVLEEIRFAVEQLRLTTEQENLRLKADQADKDRELEEIQLDLKSLKLRNGNSDSPGQ